MTDRDKRGYGSGIGKEYHNDPESHYRKIVEERQETTNRDRLYTDITECEAVVISDRGGEYGGTTDREVQTDQSGTTTYTSVIIRFIGPSDNPSFHPDQAKKDPLSAKNKEEFLQLRSLNSSRAVKEPMLYGLIGEPEIGNIVRCTKRNNIWEINAVYERSHQPYDDFINRMANPNADSSQAAFQGKPGASGAGNNPGATPYPPPGQRDDSKFEKGACPDALKGDYKDVPTQKTSFKKYTTDEVISAIKASGQPEYIQKTMFAYISKEQPKFSFPNNNVAGIQTDGGMFKGTKADDYDYQTCFHDKHKHRAFAGFNTLERGMEVFGRIVAGKYSGKFRKPAGDSDTDALVWNYWRNWNLAATPEELKSIKKDGYFTRKGKTYRRDWNAADKKFKQAIEKWNDYSRVQTYEAAGAST